jgi:ribosome biogenesis GTPase / thiamine phosphate phosphatase
VKQKENDTKEGLVIACHGRHVWVESLDGVLTLCYFRGKKNGALVGDKVAWLESQDEGLIRRIETRKNIFYRQDEWKTKSFATNIDQIFFIVAADPEFSERQLARVLIAAQSQNIPVFIILNKEDIEKSFLKAREKLVKYENIGYTVLGASFNTKGIMPELLALLQAKITLVLGPSGVGKSTLINLLAPHAKAFTQEISRALHSGKHTTTSTTLYWINRSERTAIIDSPGFQAFGLHHVQASSLASLMPDIRAHCGKCKFYNCTHVHEPQCLVIQAINGSCDVDMTLTAIRHKIYCELFEELSKSQYK